MRLRLFLSFALVVVVTIISLVLLVRVTTQREIHAFMFRGGMTDTTELVDTLEKYYQENQSWQGVEDLLQTPGRHGRLGWGAGMGGMMNQRLLLAAPDGGLIYDSANLPAVGSLSEDELNTAIALRNGRDIVGYLLPLGGIAFDPQDQANLTARLNAAARGAGVIAGGVSLLLALLLAYTLLRPILALTTAAQSLAAGDLSQRVDASGDDELAALGKAFNQMAESLQHIEQSRRDMTADIAHELRTPLAVQRAHLEAIQDGVYPFSPENLEPVLQQNHLLARLVEDLRTLALADAGQLTLDFVSADMLALAEGVVERFKPQADSRQVDLRLIVLQKTFPSVVMDPIRVEQILINLVTNALRHTPDGGQVTISLSADSASAILNVHDTGPGIPHESMPLIFERFYRVGHSRSREEGGAGLGLAIARQLAEAHGGTLTAANHPDSGALFTLLLPLHAESMQAVL